MWNKRSPVAPVETRPCAAGGGGISQPITCRLMAAKSGCLGKQPRQGSMHLLHSDFGPARLVMKGPLESDACSSKYCTHCFSSLLSPVFSSLSPPFSPDFPFSTAEVIAIPFTSPGQMTISTCDKQWGARGWLPQHCHRGQGGGGAERGQGEHRTEGWETDLGK